MPIDWVNLTLTCILAPVLNKIIFIFFYFILFPLHSQGWVDSLPRIGTFSSPRVADLNGDGIDDIILGAGKEEFIKSDSGVVALDGRNGKMLWHVFAKDQMFGSAIFQDINADGHPDVLINGRSSELIMINGLNGQVIWRFDPRSKQNKSHRFYNFYNSQWIPDLDGDSLKDILVSNGGDITKEAYDPNRPPGYLLIMSSRTGEILHLAEMPDGKEIYMSVTVTPLPNLKDYEIIYGTGGETIGGHLYRCLLSDVIKHDLKKSMMLDSTRDRGYIGPAARVDLNRDGITDIIVNSVNGRMIAFDGKDYHRLWELRRPGTETYSSITVGQFTDDDIPDLFASYAKGTWPQLDWSTQFLADGKNGKVLFVDSLGFYQNSTGVACDWDGDGKDEILLSVNIQEIKNGFYKYFYNFLALIDFKTNEVLQVGDLHEGNNISSTPWVGDLDHDGKLDIIYVHGINDRHTYTFDGMKVHRIRTQILIKNPVKWGAYQGSEYTGVYK